MGAFGGKKGSSVGGKEDIKKALERSAYNGDGSDANDNATVATDTETVIAERPAGSLRGGRKGATEKRVSWSDFTHNLSFKEEVMVSAKPFVMPEIYDIPEASNESDTDGDKAKSSEDSLQPTMSVTTIDPQRPDIFDKLPEEVRDAWWSAREGKCKARENIDQKMQKALSDHAERRLTLENEQKKRTKIQATTPQQQGGGVPKQQTKFTKEQKIQKLTQIILNKQVGARVLTEKEIAKLKKIVDKQKTRASQKLNIINLTLPGSHPKTHNAQRRSNLSVRNATPNNTRPNTQGVKLNNKQVINLKQGNAGKKTTQYSAPISRKSLNSAQFI